MLNLILSTVRCAEGDWVNGRYEKNNKRVRERNASHNELTVISPPTVPECVAKWFEEELAEAKEMVAKRSTEELFDNLKEMNRDVREYTCGIQVILDELNAREKQNKEENE